MPRKILIVVDMQNDFITGPLGTPEARAIVPAVVSKVAVALSDDADSTVIYTRDTHEWNYAVTLEGQRLPVEHCIHGEDGWNVINTLYQMALRDERVQVINKNTFGFDKWNRVFKELGFDRRSDGVRWGRTFSIELIGVCTDICVVSNALILRALYPNAQITVDASCCAGSTPERHKAALEVMRSCQIDVIGDETNA